MNVPSLKSKTTTVHNNTTSIHHTFAISNCFVAMIFVLSNMSLPGPNAIHFSVWKKVGREAGKEGGRKGGLERREGRAKSTLIQFNRCD